uniref:HIG1 domain-containing protein n=1 Tax=Kalanchoe fedtschenkoi TaxID=63787 RepID=A0A7N0TH64_KALFE
MAIQTWITEHKLASTGTLWASAVGASMVYSGRKALSKPSLRLIHARMHAQALTLAVLSGAAAYHYYEKQIADAAHSNATAK